jgi:hypothetical protein
MTLSAVTTTDVSGNYTLRPLNGSYTVTPEGQLTFTPTSRPVTERNVQSATAQAASTAGWSRRLTKHPMRHQHERHVHVRRGETDEYGYYVFTDVLYGTYSSTPSSPAMQCRRSR